MLAIAIALLFTTAALLAALVIADSALRARFAYRQLMQEAALMRIGFAIQPAPQMLQARRLTARAVPASVAGASLIPVSPLRIMPPQGRRLPQPQRLPARAAA